MYNNWHFFCILQFAGVLSKKKGGYMKSLFLLVSLIIVVSCSGNSKKNSCGSSLYEENSNDQEPNQIPSAPQNLIVIDTGSFNMLIGWDDITDETYYEAYYMSPTPVHMGITGADETSFDFTGFGSDGTFTLGIKACNNNGC